MNKNILTTITILFLSVSLVSTISAQEENDSEQDIQETVEERLESARSRLKAFIGIVTNKTEETMQLENDNNEIKLISVNEDVSYARTNGSSESIEFDDVGIGDYVISMGTINENNVLTAQRIVVASEPEEIADDIFLAEITLSEDDIQVEIKPDNSILTLELNSGYTITETDEDGTNNTLRLSSLAEGDRIIIVGVQNDDIFETDRLHITERAQTTEE